MDPLSLTTTTTTTPFSINQFPLTLFSVPRTLRNTNYGRNPSKFLVLASKDDPRLNQWDQMELKFGKMLGEDPKLTLAKVMGKKLNPDASYMEIEKSFHKKKGKLGDIEEIPLDWAKKGKSSSDTSNGLNLVRPAPKKVQSSDSLSGLNLARPVPKKGVKFEVDDKPKTLQIKKPTQAAGMAFEGTKRSVPNVILRKPSVYNEDDEETEKTSKLRIKPNLSLRMGREQANDKFSDMTLLRKPQQMIASTDDVEGESEAEVVVDVELKMRKEQPRDTVSDIPLLKKPEAVSVNANLDEMQRPSSTAEAEVVVDVELKMRKEQPRDTVGDIPLLKKPEAVSINTNLDEMQRPSSTAEAELVGDVELKMRKEQPRDTVSDIPLLKKSEAVSINTNLDEMQRPSSTAEAELVVDVELKTRKEQPRDTVSDIPLLQKPVAISINKNLDEIQRPSGTTDAVSRDEIEKNSLRAVSAYKDIVDATTNSYEKFLESDDGSFLTEVELEDDSLIGLQPLKQSNMEFTENESSLTEASDMYVVNSSDKFSMEAALQGKPKRLDQSVKETSKSTRPEKVLGNLESYVNAELENFLATSPLKESEDIDWRRAEDQVKTGGREEVELISCSIRGFVVSCGSLIGFLPYRNLAAKWKFLAFESWLRMKGLDPSTHRQSLGIIGSYDAANKNIPLDSGVNPESDRKSGELSSDMKLEELLSIYDQEKIKFLSSFVGQRIKVNVLIADRKSRKLIFSIRPKEKEELVERKRSLMAKLSIGDVVKCCIKKITYFGIFVEVQGVPALIHQTEVSWDTTLDPASYYKIGQIVEAKVHQLDFALERIFLSLKEITPDPLIEALESVVGDPNSLDERLQAAEPDTEWSDVESLIKELQQIDGIQSVSKGRYFLSPGLAPTFQVYMASMFENQYKLLARAGNQVQEVIVQASLGKEEMKSAILTCTSRVE